MHIKIVVYTEFYSLEVFNLCTIVKWQAKICRMFMSKNVNVQMYFYLRNVVITVFQFCVYWRLAYVLYPLRMLCLNRDFILFFFLLNHSTTTIIFTFNKKMRTFFLGSFSLVQTNIFFTNQSCKNIIFLIFLTAKYTVIKIVIIIA